LTGTIPSSLLSTRRMKQMMLQNNQLTGTLPVTIGEMKDLGKGTLRKQNE